MPDVWTLLIAVAYPVGLVATFTWGLIRFRTSDGWDCVGDRLWYARRDGARLMLVSPIWPIGVGVAVLALLACSTAMAWYFLIDMIRVARGRA